MTITGADVREFFSKRIIIILLSVISVFFTWLSTRFFVSHNSDKENIVKREEVEELKQFKSDKLKEEIIGLEKVKMEASLNRRENILKAAYDEEKRKLTDAFVKKNEGLDKREASLSEREKTFAKQLEELGLLIKQAEQTKKEAWDKKEEVRKLKEKSQKLIDGKVRELLGKKMSRLQGIKDKSEYTKILRTKELESLGKEIIQATPRVFGSGDLNRQLAYKEEIRSKRERKQKEIEDNEREFQEELKNTADEFDAVIKELNSLKPS